MYRYAQHQPEPEGYVSEFTLFMNDFLEEHPEVVEDQRKGWYLFWDHHVDMAELKPPSDAIPQQPYEYFSWNHKQNTARH